MVDWNLPALDVGSFTISFGELMLVAMAAIFILLITIICMMLLRRPDDSDAAIDEVRRHQELEIRLAEMAGRLQSMSETAASRESHLARTLNQRLDQVAHRVGINLESSTRRTGESLRQLHERIAVIDTAQQNITALSNQMVGLQDILANKQARGAFGQGRMEAIIADQLPKGAYTFQHQLSNGTRPDCAIHLPNNDLVLVIDAKFPLEAFQAVKDAGDPQALKDAAQRLRTDLNKHIKDISQKYLIPGETQDTAIMFVPSESIYADLHESFVDIIQKAYRARVVIVSPNMLMLSIQTIQSIFKDAQMREQAGLIKNEVVKMLEDVQRLRDRVLDLQRHFGQANQDIDKILTSSEKLSKRGLKIEQLELEDEASDGSARLDGPKLVAGE